MEVKLVTKCPNCGEWVGATVNPASLMGKQKKTMTPAAIAARKANASKPRIKKIYDDKPVKIK